MRARTGRPPGAGMKVLFLDVDGVLNSNERRAYDYEGIRGMDPELTGNLLRIVLQTDCGIVVSSSWRLGGIGPGTDFAVALASADRSGVCLQAVIGATPVPMGRTEGGLYVGLRRRDEILTWLEDHAEEQRVTRYAIIDDEPRSIVDGQDDWLHEHMFATDDDLGLTAEVADRVIAHLNGEASRS